MTPDRESRLEAALAALLAEVVNMREDYPAEAWRFSDEAIANAESAMELPQSVANRASILGTVEFSYSDSDTKCACCPVVAMPMADAFAWMIGRALRQHIYLVIQTASFVTSRPSMSTLGSA